MDSQGCITFIGSSYERGYQFGSRFRVSIVRYLNDSYFRINKIRRKPLSVKAIRQFGEAAAELIKSDYNDLFLELKGISEGCSVDIVDIVNLQYRRELIILDSDLSTGGEDCTTTFIGRDQVRILGQTIDQEGLIGEFLVAVKYIDEPQSDAPEILMLTFAGMPGYLGMNSEGVAISINMLTAGSAQCGLSAYLIVREALKKKNADQALAFIKSAPKSSARSLTVVDANNQYCCEFTPSDLVVNKIEDEFFRANHILDASLGVQDSINLFSKNSSIKRQNLLSSLVSNTTGALELFSAFSNHDAYPIGICAHPNGNIRAPETVGSVVMDINKNEMLYTLGMPCCNEIRRAFF